MTRTPDSSRSVRAQAWPAAAGSNGFASDSTQGDILDCRDCLSGGSFSNCKTINTGALPQGVAAYGKTVYLAVTYYQEILSLDDACGVIGNYSDPGYLPVGVAISRSGILAVTNICSGMGSSCFGPGNISFYAPGSTSVTSVATGLISRFYFGAFDKHGNFYNDGTDASGNVVVGVVPAGGTVNEPTGISGIGFPGGMQVAKNGTLNIDDQDCACIGIFKGATRIGTMTLGGASDPVSFALDKKNLHAWVADAGTATVGVFPYPAGGSPIITYTGFTTPVGIGLLPAGSP